MCLLCSACSVSFHIFSFNRRVHCSLRDEGGMGNTMFLILLGERGIISVETFAYFITCWKICISYTARYNFQTIRWKSLSQFIFLVSSPDPTREERVWWHSAILLGFINVDYFLGRIFHPPITLQKTLETICYFSTMTPVYWHWKN